MGKKVEALFNPICGSSSFINGTVMLPNGKINRGKGILQNLVELEGENLKQTTKNSSIYNKSERISKKKK